MQRVTSTHVLKAYGSLWPDAEKIGAPLRHLYQQIKQQYRICFPMKESFSLRIF